jgi:hypothetical protein
MLEAVSFLGTPHERQKRRVTNSGNLLVYEMSPTWYQSAQGTAKSKLARLLSSRHYLTSIVGFYILDSARASKRGSHGV